MTERKQFREHAEPGGGLKQKLKTKLAGLTLLSALLLGKPGVGVAQEVKTQDRKDYGKEIVMKETSDSKAATDTISRYDVTGGEGIGIEPDPVGGDSEELEPTDEGADTGMEKELPVKFTISTGLGYSIGGKAFMSNRVAGFGQLPGGVNVYSHMDFDDPLHTTGSGKLTLSKSIYKGITLDGDYTFTGTGGNVARFGIGYGGKIGDGTYGIKLYPLNTGGSPIAVKVSVSTKIGSDGQLSSFVFVDFGNMGYYSETEYAHEIAKGIAIFIQTRLGGVIDGSFNGDSQKLVGGVRISVK